MRSGRLRPAAIPFFAGGLNAVLQAAGRSGSNRLMAATCRGSRDSTPPVVESGQPIALRLPQIDRSAFDYVSVDVIWMGEKARLYCCVTEARLLLPCTVTCAALPKGPELPVCNVLTMFSAPSMSTVAVE
jgi:hypothetical protein